MEMYELLPRVSRNKNSIRLRGIGYGRSFNEEPKELAKR